MTIYRNGWPDKIEDDRAVEEMRWPAQLKANQRATHEWLHRHTGRYPAICYVDREGKDLRFESYLEFEQWYEQQKRMRGTWKRSATYRRKLSATLRRKNAHLKG